MTELNDLVVAGLGIATVFAALICIIMICNITGVIFRLIDDKSSKSGNTQSTTGKSAQTTANTTTSSPITSTVQNYVTARIENRGAVIAAISAAIAEDCGTDISRIRILSVRERADSIPDRAQLCAAISAVIAQETGAEHVRVHSIKRV